MLVYHSHIYTALQQVSLLHLLLSTQLDLICIGSPALLAHDCNVPISMTATTKSAGCSILLSQSFPVKIQHLVFLSYSTLGLEVSSNCAWTKTSWAPFFPTAFNVKPAKAFKVKFNKNIYDDCLQNLWTDRTRFHAAFCALLSSLGSEWKVLLHSPKERPKSFTAKFFLINSKID